jgi:hypothetical protein
MPIRDLVKFAVGEPILTALAAEGLRPGERSRHDVLTAAFGVPYTEVRALFFRKTVLVGMYSLTPLPGGEPCVESSRCTPPSWEGVLADVASIFQILFEALCFSYPVNNVHKSGIGVVCRHRLQHPVPDNLLGTRLAPVRQ